MSTCKIFFSLTALIENSLRIHYALRKIHYNSHCKFIYCVIKYKHAQIYKFNGKAIMITLA